MPLKRSAPGQEATAVGIALDLRPEDSVVPAPHGPIVQFLKGVPLDALFAPPPPNSARSSSNATPSVAPHLNVMRPSAALSDRCNAATGAALAHKLRKSGNIAVVFCGERPASLAVWQESLLFAGTHQLPLLFVVQDGPGAPGGRWQLSGGARSYGFPGIPVDSNDVVAVYRVAQEAIVRARRGGGPTLIEAVHYAPASEAGFQPDPLARMETYLIAKGLFTPAWKRKVAANFRKQLDAAVKAGVPVERPARRPHSQPEDATVSSPTPR